MHPHNFSILIVMGICEYQVNYLRMFLGDFYGVFIVLCQPTCYNIINLFSFVLEGKKKYKKIKEDIIMSSINIAEIIATTNEQIAKNVAIKEQELLNAIDSEVCQFIKETWSDSLEPVKLYVVIRNNDIILTQEHPIMLKINHCVPFGPNPTSSNYKLVEKTILSPKTLSHHFGNLEGVNVTLIDSLIDNTNIFTAFLITA